MMMMTTTMMMMTTRRSCCESLIVLRRSVHKKPHARWSPLFEYLACLASWLISF